MKLTLGVNVTKPCAKPLGTRSWSYTKKADTKINNIIKADTERKCLKWQKMSTMKSLKDQLLVYIKMATSKLDQAKTITLLQALLVNKGRVLTGYGTAFIAIDRLLHHSHVIK